MKTEQIVQAFEEAVRQLGLGVRRDAGHFRGGRCTINGEDLVMLNKRHPPEVHLVVLAEVLQALPVDSIYLRPAVRDAMEMAWQRHAETLRDALFEQEADAE